MSYVQPILDWFCKLNAEGRSAFFAGIFGVIAMVVSVIALVVAKRSAKAAQGTPNPGNPGSEGEAESRRGGSRLWPWLVKNWPWVLLVVAALGFLGWEFWLAWPPAADWIPIGLALLAIVGIAGLLYPHLLSLLKLPPLQGVLPGLLVPYALGGAGLAAGGTLVALLWGEGIAGLSVASHWLAIVLLGLAGAAGGAWLALRHEFMEARR